MQRSASTVSIDSIILESPSNFLEKRRSGFPRCNFIAFLKDKPAASSPRSKILEYYLL